jgi:hypothetical protein
MMEKNNVLRTFLLAYGDRFFMTDTALWRPQPEDGMMFLRPGYECHSGEGMLLLHKDFAMAATGRLHQGAVAS